MITIDWGAFLLVFISALTGAVFLVGFYALGLRLLVAGGKPPVVHPAEFPDAITVMSPKQIRKAEKKAAKAAKKVPLSPKAQRLVLLCAYSCFALCAAVIVFGVLLLLVFR